MTLEIVVPNLGESVVEATVSRWLKQEGDHVAVGDPVVVLETEKVDLEVGAERDGVLAKIAAAAGQDVKIGEVLGLIEASEGGAVSAPAPAAAPVPASAPVPPPDPASGAAAVTPVARRMAEEAHVDLSKVEASGSRVTKADVQRHLERADAPPAPVPVPMPTAAPYPAPVPDIRGEDRVKMSRRRRTIATRLVEAQHSAAMLTTFNEIDMSAVMRIREKRRDSFKEKHGVGLGFSSFFVKAAIGALKAFPRLNAEIQGDEMILKRYYDIGVAIGAEEGLVVPVLRDADRLSFAQIEQAIKKYAAEASAGTLSLEALRGGTFTITNGGVFGSMLSTPILNPPQVAILGLHKIEQRPIALNGEVVIRPMMYVAMSYDHRIVDGREAVSFLVRVKELVEDPESLLIEG
ncbi:MAG: 2-oxoglutarate dehydrogenase complex dihydrolipoyllysine-residue succinyltransferase [Anaerolineae bacterium]|nr:2-oxoglutarate dehydrogenase complex dihydrolipoyllysine-residue succinyltransferase [Anaerolineae bacterium]